MPTGRIVRIETRSASFFEKLPGMLAILFLLTGAASSCKDDPIGPPTGGKDSCDTCIVDTCLHDSCRCDTCICDTCLPCDTCVVCDTCTIDTTDTVVVLPGDTTSHDFTWTEYSIPGEASIGGCWVFNKNEVWVLGGKLYTLTNGEWVHKPLKNQHGHSLDEFGDFSGANLFGFTPNDTWIIHTGILWHYRDNVAQEIRLYQDGIGLLNFPEDGSIRAAWGTSSNDMFFVGDNGVIVHYDGSNWTKFPKVTQKNLRKVWGTSSDDVWAAGFNSSSAESVLLHYNGSAWTEIQLASIGDIRVGAHALGTVWTIDSAGHSTVFAAGSLVWRKTDNGPWRSDSGKVTNKLSDGGFVGLYAIRGNSTNDVMLSGAAGWIAHWNGRSWYQYSQLFNWGNMSYDTSPLSFVRNTAVLAGAKAGKGFVALGRRVK